MYIVCNNLKIEMDWTYAVKSFVYGDMYIIPKVLPTVVITNIQSKNLKNIKLVLETISIFKANQLRYDLGYIKLSQFSNFTIL